MKSPCLQCGKTVVHLSHERPFCSVGCNADYASSVVLDREMAEDAQRTVEVQVCDDPKHADPCFRTDHADEQKGRLLKEVVDASRAADGHPEWMKTMRERSAAAAEYAKDHTPKTDAERGRAFIGEAGPRHAYTLAPDEAEANAVMFPDANGMYYCAEHHHEQTTPCPDCADEAIVDALVAAKTGPGRPMREDADRFASDAEWARFILACPGSEDVKLRTVTLIVAHLRAELRKEREK